MSKYVVAPEIDRLPEPARSLANQIVSDLIATGHPAETAAAKAAMQAACYVSERAWDSSVTGAQVLHQLTKD